MIYRNAKTRMSGLAEDASVQPIDMTAPDAQTQLATVVNAWESGAAQPPSTVIVDSAGAGLSFENMIKSAAAIAKEVMTYKRQDVPGGGAIYQKIDPSTGRPAVTTTTLKLTDGQSGASSFIEKNKTQIGIGLAFLLLRTL